MNDRSPDAYERLVDRLLASPHYGERWARHWMDLVHFAETHGHDQDRIRPNAWPYRDYLIRLVQPRHALRPLRRRASGGRRALSRRARAGGRAGHARGRPWDESSLRDIRDDSIDRQIGHYIDRDDMVSTVMSTFVSATVHCARCHDHKFDPISQDDYYSLQAVFAGVDKAERGYDADPALDRLRRIARGRAQGGRESRPRAGRLAQGRAGGVAAAEPGLRRRPATSCPTPATSRPAGRGRCSVLRRGDIHFPGKPAVAGHPGLRRRTASRGFSRHAGDDESARRAGLARWIIDPRNPLTWRSIVNRVWQHHFGRGLVVDAQRLRPDGRPALAPRAARLAGLDVPRVGRLAQAARTG